MSGDVLRAPEATRRLYLVERCPFGHRANFGLREKELSVDFVFIDPHNRPPELVELGILGRSPTLFDGDAVVCESGIILQYLEDRYPDPPLMPRGAAERAQVRQSVAWFEQEILPSIHAFAMEALFAQPRDDERLRQATREVEAKLPRFEAYIGERPYVAGAHFGLADIMVFPLFPCLASLGCPEVSPELTGVRQWLSRVSARTTAYLPMPAMPSPPDTETGYA